MAINGSTSFPGASGALVLPSIPGATARLVAYGDSLTQGIGASNIGGVPSPLYLGVYDSWPGFFASTAAGLGMSVYNLGISGQTTLQGLNQYAENVVSTTGTTNGTASVAITGTTTGLSRTMVVVSSSGDIPLGTTATISGTTVTLSQSATGSHAGQTLVFATAVGYGILETYYLSAHLLSNAVTGHPTYFAINYGTNDYYLDGITSSGTATTGSANISAMTINTAASVGGSLTATPGYNAWGGTGTGFGGTEFTYLGTVSSATSSTVTLSSGENVTSSMTTFKFAPALSTWEANYTSLVNDALADGNIVIVQTLIPCIYPALGYNQQQYDENRLLYNAWLRTTFANNAFSPNVYLFDIANVPQFQPGPNASLFRNTTVYPHLNDLGYSVWSNFIYLQFLATFPSLFTEVIYPQQRFGIQPSWLPVTTPATNASNEFTVSQQIGSLSTSGTANLTVCGNVTMSSSDTNGNEAPTLVIQSSTGASATIEMYYDSTQLLSLQAQNGGVTGVINFPGYYIQGTTGGTGLVTNGSWTVLSNNGYYNPEIIWSNDNGTRGIVTATLTSTAFTLVDSVGGTFLSETSSTGAVAFKAGLTLANQSKAASAVIIAGFNVLTGTTASQTGTLPVPTVAGQSVIIKNQSSQSWTIASNTGSQIIASGAVPSAVVASITLASGADMTLWSDGVYWNQL